MLEPALLREDQGVLRLLPFIFFMIQLLPSARMAECNVFWSWNDISTIAISILVAGTGTMVLLGSTRYDGRIHHESWGELSVIDSLKNGAP